MSMYSGQLPKTTSPAIVGCGVGSSLGVAVAPAVAAALGAEVSPVVGSAVTPVVAPTVGSAVAALVGALVVPAVGAVDCPAMPQPVAITSAAEAIRARTGKLRSLICLSFCRAG